MMKKAEDSQNVVAAEMTCCCFTRLEITDAHLVCGRLYGKGEDSLGSSGSPAITGISTALVLTSPGGDNFISIKHIGLQIKHIQVP